MAILLGELLSILQKSLPSVGTMIRLSRKMFTCRFLVGSYSTLYSVRGTEVLAKEGVCTIIF